MLKHQLNIFLMVPLRYSSFSLTLAQTCTRRSHMLRPSLVAGCTCPAEKKQPLEVAVNLRSTECCSCPVSVAALRQPPLPGRTCSSYTEGSMRGWPLAWLQGCPEQAMQVSCNLTLGCKVLSGSAGGFLKLSWTCGWSSSVSLPRGSWSDSSFHYCGVLYGEVFCYSDDFLRSREGAFYRDFANKFLKRDLVGNITEEFGPSSGNVKIFSSNSVFWGVVFIGFLLFRIAIWPFLLSSFATK